MLHSVVTSKWLRVPLLCLTVVVVQTAFVSSLQVFDVSPDLVILLVVTTGLVAGPLPGALVGFLSGLLEDAVMTTPYALWALTLCLTGYLAGFVRRDALSENTPYQIAVTAAASAGSLVLFAVLGTVFGRTGLVTFELVPMMILVAGVNALLYVPARRVVRWALPPTQERASTGP